MYIIDSDIIDNLKMTTPIPNQIEPCPLSDAELNALFDAAITESTIHGDHGRQHSAAHRRMLVEQLNLSESRHESLHPHEGDAQSIDLNEADATFVRKRHYCFECNFDPRMELKQLTMRAQKKCVRTANDSQWLSRQVFKGAGPKEFTPPAHRDRAKLYTRFPTGRMEPSPFDSDDDIPS